MGRKGQREAEGQSDEDRQSADEGRAPGVCVCVCGGASGRGRRKQPTADVTDPMITHSARLIPGLHAKQAPGAGRSEGPTGNGKDTPSPCSRQHCSHSDSGSRGLGLPADGPPRGCQDGQGAGAGGGTCQPCGGGRHGQHLPTLLAAGSARSVNTVRQHLGHPHSAPGPPICAPRRTPQTQQQRKTCPPGPRC